MQSYFLREQVVLVSKEDRSKKVFGNITNSAPRQVNILGTSYLNGAISSLMRCHREDWESAND